jgi:hypothetical protein
MDIRLIIIIGGIVTTVIGYFLGLKKDKDKGLDNKISSSIEHLYNPLLLDILKLKKIRNTSPNLLKAELTSFFKRYTEEENSIYKLYKFELMQEFFELYSLVHSNPRIYTNAFFWHRFERFSENVEKQYWKLINAESKGIIWRVERDNMAFWKRDYIQFFNLSHKIWFYITVFCFFSLMFCLSDKLVNKGDRLLDPAVLEFFLVIFLTCLGTLITISGGTFIWEKYHQNRHSNKNYSIISSLNDKLK